MAHNALHYSLGVDLGTSYTAAAVLSNGVAEIAHLGNRHPEIPSLVFLRSDGETIVGDVAERRGADQPDRLAREFKRRLADPVPLLLGGTPFSAQALMARLLEEVVRSVSEINDAPPESLVVTHPANWGPYKLGLLVQAIRRAGLDAVELRSEPEAAAVWFASTERLRIGEIIAVYDLGGGTFDAAVLRKTTDRFELLGHPEGIEQLGGVDFDEVVLRHVLNSLGPAEDMATASETDMALGYARLRRDCVEAKEALSFDTDTVIPVDLPGRRTRVRLTRREFETMISSRLDDTVAATRRALVRAQVAPEQLSAILLAGGSSRIPLIAERIGVAFGRPVARDPHPEHSIALGAALLAGPIDRSAAVIGLPGAPRAVAAGVRTIDLPDRRADGTLTAASEVHTAETAGQLNARRRRQRTLVVMTAGLAVLVLVSSFLIARSLRTGGGAVADGAASWQRLPDLPAALEGAAVAAYEGKVWVAGGLSNDADRHKLTTVYVFDPQSGKWSTGPSLPQPISHAAMVGTTSGLYFMGGWVQQGGSREVLRLDDDLDGWTAKRALPSPRVSGAAAWDGTRLLFAGGTQPGGAAATEVWAYSSSGWTKIGDLAEPRQKLAGIGDGKDTAWFLGGGDEQKGSMSDHIDRFSQGRPSPWSETISPARIAGAAVMIDGAGLCVLGGQINADNFASWWCEQSGAADRLPKLSPPRAGLGLATIGKTTYVVGGYGSNFQGTAEFLAYSPESSGR